MPCAPQIASRPRFCLHVRLLCSYECYLRASFALFPSNVPLHPLFHLPCFPQDAQPSTACPSHNIWLNPAEASPSPSTARRAHLKCPACPQTEQEVSGAIAQPSGSQTTHGLQKSDAAEGPASTGLRKLFSHLASTAQSCWLEQSASGSRRYKRLGFCAKASQVVCNMPGPSSYWRY